jgi:hypothetical protein
MAYENMQRGYYQRVAPDDMPMQRKEPRRNDTDDWFFLPSVFVWGTWLFFTVIAGRALVLSAFVMGFLMQEREIGSYWHRDRFYWAIIASFLAEVILQRVVMRFAQHQPDGRRLLTARWNGHVLLHIFAFVAFFRTDTVHFARSESGYVAAMLIVLLDMMLLDEMQNILRAGTIHPTS